MKIEPTKVSAPSHVQYGKRLTEVGLGVGLPEIDALYEELLGYTDVILGRVDPKVESPYLTLMEFASAYYARALEIEMMIYTEEHARRVVRGSPYYKFRTGQLRSFLEMAKRMSDLGSRRLSQEALLNEQRYDAGENY